MIKFYNRKIMLLGGAIAVAVMTIGLACYLLAQSLVTHVLVAQFKRAGFPQADIAGVWLYLDGIVINTVTLSDTMMLHDVFMPQSAPDLAQRGVRHVVVRQWTQTVNGVADIPQAWPWPAIETASIEEMRLTLATPLHAVTLQGTMKSLRPDDHSVVLVLPFTGQDDVSALDGKMEMTLDGGQLASLDINLDDGSAQLPDLALKRLSGWLNAQFTPGQLPEIQAQFMAGAVSYRGNNFTNGSVQYSDAADAAPLWTIELNRPAENYFNSWSVKPTQDHRFALQVASQSGKQTKSAVMISASPLVLDPLLPDPSP